MHKKYHEKFKILDILAVTTQAHEGIETSFSHRSIWDTPVTTQAREGIETLKSLLTVLTKVVTTQVHPVPVPGKKI